MSDSDTRALHTATRRLAALTAVAITAVLVIAGAVAWTVVYREQQAESRGQLQRAVLDVDDLASAPPTIGVWAGSSTGERRSPAAPSWLPVRAAVAAVTGDQVRDERRVSRGGEDYRVLTVRRDGDVVQATISSSEHSEERDRLLTGLLAAEVGGLALSLLLGGLLARRAIAPLATAMAKQRRFVADASHELRTPLTLLSTRAQLLERALRVPASGASEAVHGESVALVEDTRRLAGVVEDLLLSASLAEHPAHRDPVDLAEIAESAVAGARAHAGELRVELTGPAYERAVTVLGAPGPLRRVVDALLDNALTHTSPGGHVRVEVEPGDPTQLRIVDDGAGIDPAVADHLFDRFAHGATAGGGRRPFGLGLSLVREIVAAHGGTVVAGGTPGGGATFTVSLPPAAR